MIRILRGTSTALALENPLLERGQPCYIVDTNQLVVGDGFTNFNDLSAIGAPPDLSDYLTQAEIDAVLDGYATSSQLTSHTGNAAIHVPAAGANETVLKVEDGLIVFGVPAINSTINSHIGDSSIHFTAASLGLDNYSTTEQLDTILDGYATDGELSSHTGDGSVHFTEASIDHGSVAGLSDDDHPQYFNQTRLDAVVDGYITAGDVSTDHGALDGLSDDDHPQYFNITRLAPILDGYAEGGDNELVPAGGDDGYLLAKASGSDYDTEWIPAPSSLPVGGTDGQVLTKTSAADYAVAWEDAGGASEWTNVILGSTFSTTSTTGSETTAGTSVTGLSFTPAINKSYLIEGMILTRSSSTDCGSIPGMSWPSNLSDGGALLQAPDPTNSSNSNSSSDATGSHCVRHWHDLTVSGHVPTIGGGRSGSSHLNILKAYLITGASTSGAVQVLLRSETGSSVSVRAGSFLRYMEIA